MTVLIEKYRGIAINFRTETELFETEIGDVGKESKSFTATKKWIDEYLKNNATFEPFYVIVDPNGYGSSEKRLKIVGIRKDGRFIYEVKGEKKQLSDYYEDRYILEEPQHAKLLAAVAALELELDEVQKKIKQVEHKITGTSLKSIKANYLQT